MDTKCKMCWWQEGGKCYNQGLYPGIDINQDILKKCASIKSYLNKRAFLRGFFPDSIDIIITSESKLNN